MELIKRTSDIISGLKDTEHLHTLPNFPVFMGCVDEPQSEDLLADSIWEIGASTGLIQLKELIPLSTLYGQSHGSGDVGRIWDNHHRSFASFISKYTPKEVLEIGGGHGRLAKLYEQHERIAWTIIEPNPTPVDSSNAKWIKGFFNSDFISEDKYDCFVHSHLFEHLYDPCEFMTDLSSYLKDGDTLIFTLPNMQEMLKRNYTNCLNFEHTYFVTEPYIEHLMTRYGFRILEKQYFMDEHSIFYAAVRDSKQPEMPLPKDLYEKNKKLFLSFVSDHEKMITDYNNRLQEVEAPTFLFGAHVFAQFLIQMGLDLNNVISILDNDVRKQGKRLYGTSMMVDAPAVLAGLKNPIVILKAGIYNQEISEDILNNINPTAVFWD